MNFLTLGHDCSPAATLRNLNLREFALPFDWVVSNVGALYECFLTDFAKYHMNLQLNHARTRLIDEYGFQFPHDYPITGNADISESQIGEGVIGEERGKQIIENWRDYHGTVIEKYRRRIARFREMLVDPRPIIVLCRYSMRDVLILQQIFQNHFKRSDVFFVNSSKEVFENDKIINIDTEKNNVWNEAAIWKQGIDKFLH